MEWNEKEMNLLIKYFNNSSNELSLYKQLFKINSNRTLKAITSKLERMRKEGYSRSHENALKKLRVGYLDIECLLPGTLIMTINGLVKIENIKEGDLVLTHKNRWQKVTKTINKNYKGKIYTFGNVRFPIIKTTPDHPFYVIETNRNSRGVFDRNNFNYNTFSKAKWKNANKLSNRDLLVSLVPEEKIWKDITSINVGKRSDSDQHKSSNIPKIIKVNDDFLKMIGIFLGDGYANEFRIELFAGIKDNGMISIIERFAKSINAKIKKIRVKNFIKITICSKQLGTFFNQFYNKDKKKYIPEKWLNLPTDRFLKILYGLFLADGYKKQGFFNLTNTSKEMIKSIVIRLNLSEIAINGYRNKGRFGFEGTKNPSDVYLLQTQKSGFHRKIWKVLDFIFRKIAFKGEEKYNGKVYNLSVENDESYIANGFITHNCTQLVADFGYIISWYIKEKGKNYYDSAVITKKEIFNLEFDKRLVKELLIAMNKYDVLYGHYSADRRFDFPFIRTRAYKHNLEKLIPKRDNLFIMDTYPIARNKLKLHSNRLGSIADALGIKEVKKTPLDSDKWIKAAVGDKTSLSYVALHNKRDVQLLERVHNKLSVIERPKLTTI